MRPVQEIISANATKPQIPKLKFETYLRMLCIKSIRLLDMLFDFINAFVGHNLVKCREHFITPLFQSLLDVSRFARRQPEIINALAGLFGCHTDIDNIRAFIVYYL